MVDSTEVGYDDRNRQSNDKHSAEWADAANDLTGDRLGYHVTVTERRHRDDSVPESGRNGGEVCAIDIFLCIEHHRREDDDSHG